MSLRLLAGLGNPGEAYASTRHNVGFMFSDFLHRDAKDPWKSWRNGKAEWFRWSGAGGKEFSVLKPQEYMNLSGQALKDFADYRKIRASEILICYDDFALPFGARRMRLKGSSGGHNGMQSIIDRFGTEEIPRLRIGIGPVPAGMDPKDFVLRKFSKDEIGRLHAEVFPDIEGIVARAQNAGFELAMNACNAPELAGGDD